MLRPGSTTKPLFPALLNHSHPLALGLVGCWLFNAKAAVAYDSSPFANTGAMTNMSPPTWKPSPFGDALTFNGSNQSVNVGSNPATNIASPFSLSLWVYQTVSGGSQTGGYIARRNSTNNFPYVLLTGTAEKARLFTDNGTIHSVQAVTAISLNAWQHLLVTYDGTNAIFYTNGFAEAAQALTAGSTSAGAAVLIGAQDQGAGPANFFTGNMDNACIWNRALSAPEAWTMWAKPFEMFWSPSRLVRARRSVSLFRGGSLSGLGSGGPFFHDPLSMSGRELGL